MSIVKNILAVVFRVIVVGYLNGLVAEDVGVKEVSVIFSVTTAAKVKNIRRGVKEVQKFINKGEKGWVCHVWNLKGHSVT